MSFLRGSWVYWVKYLGRNLLLLTPSNPSFVSFFSSIFMVRGLLEIPRCSTHFPLRTQPQHTFVAPSPPLPRVRSFLRPKFPAPPSAIQPQPFVLLLEDALLLCSPILPQRLPDLVRGMTLPHFFSILSLKVTSSWGLSTPSGPYYHLPCAPKALAQTLTALSTLHCIIRHLCFFLDQSFRSRYAVLVHSSCSANILLNCWVWKILCVNFPRIYSFHSK